MPGLLVDLKKYYIPSLVAFILSILLFLPGDEVVCSENSNEQGMETSLFQHDRIELISQAEQSIPDKSSPGMDEQTSSRARSSGMNAPVLSNYSVRFLSKKSYAFEVEYSNYNGIAPEEIWLNLSGVGTYRMEPKDATDQNWFEGVTFYSVQDLETGRYSYQIAAFDGYSWTETVQENFTVTGEATRINELTGLILSLFIGAIVAVAVVILRRK